MSENPWYSKKPVEPRTAEERIALAKEAERAWAASVEARGSPVEGYLRSRGLGLGWTQDVRYSPTYHAMVLRVSDRGRRLIAVHLTLFDASGKPERDESGHKRCRVIGSIKGGAVELGLRKDDRVILGEGIETVLSALTLTTTDILSGYACLGTAGLAGCPIRRHWKEVVIAADHDAPGISAAEKLAARLKESTVERHVKIVMPLKSGEDWNDVLQKHISARSEGKAQVLCTMSMR